MKRDFHRLLKKHAGRYAPPRLLPADDFWAEFRARAPERQSSAETAGALLYRLPRPVWGAFAASALAMAAIVFLVTARRPVASPAPALISVAAAATPSPLLIWRDDATAALIVWLDDSPDGASAFEGGG